MKRRNFICTSTLGTIGFCLTGCLKSATTHILSLSFDDGFKKSFYKTAEIHEEYGLKACLNVIASAHLENNKILDEYQTFPVGDFNDWNKLKQRGHEIMPHSWNHANLTEMPLEQAKEDILKCLDYFKLNLDGFVMGDAVYNFAYNASTPELEDFALSLVKAVRTGWWPLLNVEESINPFPGSGGPVKLGCGSFGPDNADNWVEEKVNQFLYSPGGWLILNLHGLDDEGWGPISANYLDKLLKRLTKTDYLEILPTGVTLIKFR
jgi:peptidoglycan/xylan/chitin deacetylase (PgdA/CDA1 family)